MGVKRGSKKDKKVNNSLLTLEEVLKATDGTVAASVSSKEFIFTCVATDSRKVTSNCLFIPLVNQQDGHEYIPSAIENGASVVFVTDFYAKFHVNEIFSYKKQGVFVISVSHTMYALQHLASFYVKKFPSLTKIAITGSSGKTTTKEIAVNVFSQKYKVIYNKGNLNSETGLPLSVFEIRPEHEVGIFEMGMNRKGEIAELSSVLVPDYALITNIGTAHIGILESRDNIALEKKDVFRMFSASSYGFVPEDDDYSQFLKEGVKGTIENYGIKSCDISDIKDLGIHGSSFSLLNTKINFPLYGIYNLNNALGVIALALKIGLSIQEIKVGLESVKSLFGRGQIFEGKVTVIQDCYNANPDSMNASLEFVKNLEWKGKKIFVLGSMLELGDESQEAHENIAKFFIDEEKASDLYLFGDDIKYCKDLLSAKKYQGNVFYTNDLDDKEVKSVAKKIISSIEEGDLVLVKGSRGIALERISDEIIKKFGLTEKQGEKNND